VYDYTKSRSSRYYLQAPFSLQVAAGVPLDRGLRGSHLTLSEGWKRYAEALVFSGKVEVTIPRLFFC
jgi:hypothetical protein